MRYLEGIDPTTVTQLSRIEPEWVVSTAVYGFLVGLVFWVAGRRVRELWLTWWGGGLSVASVIYLGYTYLFGY